MHLIYIFGEFTKGKVWRKRISWRQALSQSTHPIVIPSIEYKIEKGQVPDQTMTEYAYNPIKSDFSPTHSDPRSCGRVDRTYCSDVLGSEFKPRFVYKYDFFTSMPNTVSDYT